MNLQRLIAVILPLWLVSESVSGFSVRPSLPNLNPSRSRTETADKSISQSLGHMHLQLKKTFSSVMAATVLATSLLGPLPTHAADSQIIGQIQGSGLVFKDTLEVERFDDPKIKGITLYITNFQRPITERLTSNFLQDPSYASVACVKSSPSVAVADNINMTPQGEEVFQESKSILFKTLRGRPI
jgi:catabolite regulation protein CreA